MKILIFKIKSVCYDSTFYLADLYGRTLASMGHEIEYFCTDEEPISALERYEGKRFDAMLDFNSLLPNLDTDEGTLFLDNIDAPFYNYILDHPLYHNKQLKAELHRYHVICLDHDHAAYIRRYYKHIKSVTVLPLCGLPFLQTDEAYSVSKLFKDSHLEPVNMEADSIRQIPKTLDLVFTGTYSGVNDMYQKMMSFGSPFSDEMKRLADIMISCPWMTQEEAVLKWAEETGLDTEKFNVPDRLYAFFLVDMYVKYYFREKVLEAVLETGRRLAVYGGNWDTWETKYRDQLDIHQMVPFKDSPRVLAGGRISVNVMPWFKAGIHDRVFTAMRSGTVSFTDGSKMLGETFADERDLLVYDLTNLSAIPEKLEKYLSDDSMLERVRQRGMETVQASHTEVDRCRDLEKIFIQA